MAQTQRQPARLSKPLITVYSEDVELRLINDYIFKYVFGREETKDILLDLVLHYIELYKPEAGTAGQDSAGLAPAPTRLQAWIELLCREREGEDMKVLLRDDLIFQKAHEAFQWCTHDRESRELALSQERFLRDQASNLEFALEQGIEKGIEQGINTGREEAKLENAKAMKHLGLDPAVSVASLAM